MAGGEGSLDTKVEGDPAAVTKAATWLRGTLAKNVEDAGDEQQDARNDARGRWEGETASSYLDFSTDVLKATDKHAERVKRAATALDDYAAKLKRCIDDMAGIRSQASGGGLTVTGTVITRPPDVPAGVVEAGSPEEAARTAAIDKVELWNTVVEEATKAWSDFTDWVDAEMPGEVARAREKDGSDTALDVVEKALPNFAAGVGSALTGRALKDLAADYKAEAAEFRRKSKVSGDPRINGSADTPAGRSFLDDLKGKAGMFGKGGRLLSGPAGIGIDIGFGIKDGVESGDWSRAALTTGASIAGGAAVVAGGAALAAAGVATAPVWATAVAAGAVAAGTSWVAGEVYDNWDDITDQAEETWDDAKDVAGKAWDKVTPW